MLKYLTLAALLGIGLTSCTFADDAKQAGADATPKCKCLDAKCDTKCAAAKSVATKKKATTVAVKLAASKAACADCPTKCGKTKACSEKVVTDDCSSKQCTDTTSACQSGKGSPNATVYSLAFRGSEDGECKKKKVAAVVAPRPARAAFPVLPSPHVAVPPPIAYSPYYAPYVAVAAASCKCGTSCGCKATDKLADDSKLLHRLATITAENSWLKAHVESRHEAAKEQEALREQLFEIQLEYAKLEAIHSQREELIEEIVEATVEKAEMQAHIAVMEERLQLQEEIGSLQRTRTNSKTDAQRVESIVTELTKSRSENAVLKAKVIELEAKIDAISERVARQSPVQVR